MSGPVFSPFPGLMPGPVPDRPPTSGATGTVAGIFLGTCIGCALTDHPVIAVVTGIIGLVIAVGALRTFSRRGIGDMVPTSTLLRAREEGRTVALRVDGRWPRLLGSRRLPVRTLPTETPQHSDEHGNGSSLVYFPFAVTVLPRDAPAYRTRMLIDDSRVLEFFLGSVHAGVLVREGFPDVAVVRDDRSVWDGPAFPPLSRDLPVRRPRLTLAGHLFTRGGRGMVVRNVLTAVFWGLVAVVVSRWLG